MAITRWGGLWWTMEFYLGEETWNLWDRMKGDTLFLKVGALFSKPYPTCSLSLLWTSDSMTFPSSNPCVTFLCSTHQPPDKSDSPPELKSHWTFCFLLLPQCLEFWLAFNSPPSLTQPLYPIQFTLQPYTQDTSNTSASKCLDMEWHLNTEYPGERLWGSTNLEKFGFQSLKGTRLERQGFTKLLLMTET